MAQGKKERKKEKKRKRKRKEGKGKNENKVAQRKRNEDGVKVGKIFCFFFLEYVQLCTWMHFDCIFFFFLLLARWSTISVGILQQKKTRETIHHPGNANHPLIDTIH